MRAARLARGWIAGLVPVVLVAACGSGEAEEAGQEDTTATTASATTETTLDEVEAERQEVIDAFLAAEDAALAAVAPPIPDPDHPDLLATHTGPMLEARQTLATGLRELGWAIELPEDSRFRLEVLSVDFDEVDGDDAAFLDACAVDDGERFVVETGELIAGGLVTVRSTNAMRRVNGEWMLAESREDERWEGEDGCALR